MADHEKNKQVTIIVNGKPKQWNEKEITYRQVIQLEFPGATQDYTVSYTVNKKEFQLVASSTPVRVKEGMEFDVDGTDNS